MGLIPSEVRMDFGDCSPDGLYFFSFGLFSLHLLLKNGVYCQRVWTQDLPEPDEKV